MKLEKNHTITIYDDRISERRSGGKKMRLIKRIIKHPDKEYWHVRFVGENLSRYLWIPTASKEEETGLDS
jgi:hypothetical protein